MTTTTTPKWVAVMMPRDYDDEDTGKPVWGVYPTHLDGYGHDTFATQAEAREYARELNAQDLDEQVRKWYGQ
jgi:hypothetical protein